MAKNRKSKRQNNRSGGFLLIAIIVAVSLFLYLYRSNDNFRSQVDERIALVKSYLSEKFGAGADGGSLRGEKLVLLPKNLEKPSCPGDRGAGDHQIRKFSHYSVCYRESYEQAEWSAYCLTEEQLVKNASRSNDFRPDPKIISESASLSDYKGSGYDRGHLTPAADMGFSEEAMSETFFMSNMSPQTGSLNRGIWKDLESQVRHWAKKFGRVYVISGPVLEKPSSDYKSIGKNKVSVPEFYYKVILAPLYDSEDDKKTPSDAKNLIAVAFIFPNGKCSKSLADYVVPVDEVERRTKIDFFSLLEDGIEDRLEASAGGEFLEAASLK